MPKYITLKRASGPEGSHNFGPGETISLTEKEAKGLLADNAIEPVEKEAKEVPAKP